MKYSFTPWLVSLLFALCFVGNLNAQAPYCRPGYGFSTCNASYHIVNYTFESINNSSGCSANDYTYYSGITAPTVILGQNYGFSVEVATGSSAMEFAIWIDFNQDDDFNDAGERVIYWDSYGTTELRTGNFTIPSGASSGVTRMRIQYIYNQTPDPCVPNDDASYVETEDYQVNICGASVGVTLSGLNGAICNGAPENISANGLGSKTIVQWEESPNGQNGWTSIPGSAGANPLNTGSVGATTYYRAVISDGSCQAYTESIKKYVGNPNVNASANPSEVCRGEQVDLSAIVSPTNNTEINYERYNVVANGLTVIPIEVYDVYPTTMVANQLEKVCFTYSGDNTAYFDGATYLRSPSGTRRLLLDPPFSPNSASATICFAANNQTGNAFPDEYNAGTYRAESGNLGTRFNGSTANGTWRFEYDSQSSFEVASIRNVSLTFATTTQWTPQPDVNPEYGLNATANPTAPTTYTAKIRIPFTKCNNTSSVNVTIAQEPNIDAGADDEVCALEYNLNAAALGSPGTGTWRKKSGPGNASFDSPNSPSTKVTVDQYGVYVFEWDVAYGNCDDQDEVEITFNKIPDVPQTSDKEICEGESIGLSADNAAPDTTYKWFDAAVAGNLLHTGQVYTVSPTTSTSYFVQAQNGSCVQNTRSRINVTVHEKPVVDAGPDDGICADTIQLNAANLVKAGTGTWSSEPGNPGTSIFDNANDRNTVVRASSFGTYVYEWKVEWNAGNCADSSTVTINFNTTPKAPITSNDTICEGEMANLQADNFHADTTYRWFDAASAGTELFVGSPYMISPSQNTTYYVQAEFNGCVQDARSPLTLVVHEKPTLDAGTDTTVCADTLFLNAEPLVKSGTGTWYDVAGNPGNLSFDNPNDPKSMARASAYGLYEAKWKIEWGDNSRCADSSLVEIEYIKTPDVPSTKDTSLCDGESLDLTVLNFGADTNYTWYDAASAGNVLSKSHPYTITGQFLNDSTYFVEAEHKGCTQANRASIFVKVHENPTVKLDSLDFVKCYGGSDGYIHVDTSYTLGAAGHGPVTWTWSDNPIDTNKRDGLSAGWYTVDVTDANGCKGSRTYRIDEPDSLQLINTRVDSQICAGSSDGAYFGKVLGGTGPYVYWLNGADSNAVSGVDSSFSITGLSSGPYTVSVGDANACVVEFSFTVDVDPLEADYVNVNGQDAMYNFCAGDRLNFVLNYDDNNKIEGKVKWQYSRTDSSSWTVLSDLDYDSVFTISKAMLSDTGYYRAIAYHVEGSDCYDSTWAIKLHIDTVSAGEALLVNGIPSSGHYFCNGETLTFTTQRAAFEKLEWKQSSNPSSLATNTPSYTIPSASFARDNDVFLLVASVASCKDTAIYDLLVDSVSAGILSYSSENLGGKYCKSEDISATLSSVYGKINWYETTDEGMVWNDLNQSSPSISSNVESRDLWWRAEITGSQNPSCKVFTDTAFFEVSDFSAPTLNITLDGANGYQFQKCSHVEYDLDGYITSNHNGGSTLWYGDNNDDKGIGQNPDLSQLNIKHYVTEAIDKVYYLAYSDDYGCQSIDSIRIQTDFGSGAGEITGPSEGCLNSKITLIAENSIAPKIVWEYYDENSRRWIEMASETDTSYVYRVKEPRSFRIKGSTLNGFCEFYSDSFHVDVFNALPPQVDIYINDQLNDTVQVCSEVDNLVVMESKFGVKPFTYAFFGSAAPQVRNAFGADDYFYYSNTNLVQYDTLYIETTDANGCMSYDSIRIETIQGPIHGDISGPSNTCNNESDTLFLNAYTGNIQWQEFNENTLEWEDLIGQTSDELIIQRSEDARFRVKVSNNNCEDISEVYTYRPNLFGSYNFTFLENGQEVNNIVLCTGDIINLGVEELPTNGDATYTWSNSNNLTLTNKDYQVIYQSNSPISEYKKVEVVDSEGCTALDSILIVVDEKAVAGNMTSSHENTTVCHGMAFDIMVANWVGTNVKIQRFNTQTQLWEDFHNGASTLDYGNGEDLSYRAIVYNSNNECNDTTAVFTQSVSKLPQPSFTIKSIGFNDVQPIQTCEGSTLQFGIDNASQGIINYNWYTVNPGAIVGFNNKPEVQVKSNGPGNVIVGLRVSDYYGCEKTELIEFEAIDDSFVGQVTADVDSICEGTGNVLSLNGASAEKVQWYHVNNGRYTEIVGETGSSYNANYNSKQDQYAAIVQKGLCKDTTNIYSVYIHPPLDTVAIDSDNEFILCENGSIKLFTNIGGNLLWSTGEVSDTIIYSGGDFVSVEFTDPNGCGSVTAEANLIRSEELSPSLHWSQGPDSVLCGDEINQVQVKLEDVTANLYSIRWKGDKDLNKRTYTVKGTEKVFAELNLQGCIIYTDTVSFKHSEFNDKPVIVSNKGNGTVCPGEGMTVRIDGDGYLFWGNDTTDNAISKDIYKDTTLVAYSRNEDGCLTGSDIFLVEFVPAPEKPEIKAIGGEVSFCEGESVEVYHTASAGYWNGNKSESERSIIVENSAQVYFTAVNEYACETASDTFELFMINAPENVRIKTADEFEFCEGDSLRIWVDNADNFNVRWIGDTLVNVDSLWVKSSGVFAVELSDTSGKCAQESPTVYVRKNKNPTPSSLSIIDDRIRSSIYTGIQWYLVGTGALPGEIDFYIKPENYGNGEYFVRRVDENGCVANSDTINWVYVSVNEAVIGEYSVFPNPVAVGKSISIKGPYPNGAKAYLFGIDGSMHQLEPGTAQSFELPTSLAKGEYILFLEAERSYLEIGKVLLK